MTNYNGFIVVRAVQHDGYAEVTVRNLTKVLRKKLLAKLETLPAMEVVEIWGRGNLRLHYDTDDHIDPADVVVDDICCFDMSDPADVIWNYIVAVVDDDYDIYGDCKTEHASDREPKLIVYIRKMTADVAYHAYSVRNVLYKERKRLAMAVRKDKRFANVRIENREVVWGLVDGNEDVADFDDFDDYESDDCTASKVTDAAKNIVERVLGRSINIEFDASDMGKSLGSLIYGDDFGDMRGSFTEDEWSALS